MTPPPGEDTRASEGTRDPAETLLAARTVEGVEEDAPSPAEEALFRRVREEGARRRTIRRRLTVAGLAAVVLIAAALWARSARAPMVASTPPPAEAPATSPMPSEPTPSPAAGGPADRAPAVSAAARPAPARSEERTATVEADERRDASAARAASGTTARRAEPAPAPRETVELPARAARQQDGTASRQSPAVAAQPREAPAAMPRAATPRPAPDVRVEVARVPNGTGVDYTVRVSRPDGAPVNGADVRVRGIMSDGGLVEAPLEPGGEPGVYRGLLTFSPRGPRGLTIRVARGGDLVEVPVTE